MSTAEHIFAQPRQLRADFGLAKRLPSLAPPDLHVSTDAPDAKQHHGIRFSSSSAADESTNFRHRDEVGDACARLTVYALTTCILIFAFPVGFALLIFNILGGENLRTTSHALALTGLGLALFLPGAGFAAFF